MGHFTSLFMVPPLLLGVLFFVAMLIGFIDSLAGGGGLLTIPALMAAGMPPVQALTINKLQTCGGSVSSSPCLTRRGVANLADRKLNIFMTFIGPMGGALLAQHVRSDVLRQILPALVICISLYSPLIPKIGEEGRQCRLYGLPFVLVTGDCVGLYDGFFDPTVKSFYALVLVMLCEYNLAKSAAYVKALNATPSIGGLLLFVLGGKVIWATGFMMFIGQLTDARMDSRLVLSKRQKLIRPMTVIVSAVMSAKLLYDSHGQETFHWLGMNQ